MDGQLGDCDLTLREVNQIEESLTKSLCAMYHVRVAYPAPGGQAPAPSETPAPQAPAG
jgi:membrane-associated HD superfamily phosphohydrolase